MSEWKRVSRRGPDRSTRSGPRPRSGRFLGTLLLLGLGLNAVPAEAVSCGSTLTASVKTTEGLPPDSGEASGLAASSRYPGVAWMVRDSGHPPSLYALRFDADGRATNREIPVEGAQNHDWEDVTYFTRPDGQTSLWVIESGQGGGNRVIYEIAEPDPDTATSVRPAARYTYSYPDRNTNTEAAFTWNGSLVLATKTFPTRLYIFAQPLSSRAVNRPTLVGELTDSNGISVAKPSPDGRWVITATHDTVYMYRNTKAPGALEGFTNQEPFHLIVAAPEDNVEAGDFVPPGDCQLLLLSEQRNTYRLAGR